MLTLVFLRFMGEKYEAGVAALRERLIKEGLDPDNEEIIKAFFDDATFADGTFDLPKEARWSTIINTAAPQLNVAPDTDTMNRRVAKMVEEALKYNNVESILEEGEEMDIFGPEFTERLKEIKMPASKLETLIKLLRKQITEYGRTNQVASKKFQEMLEATIKEYHNRRKFLSEEEAGETQEATAESIIKNATEQALNILKGMQADRESFRKLGLTFEEKAFYDILIHLRDKNNFVYGEDKDVDGVVINDKCKSLACKIREIIDTKSSFSDWLNNQRVRDQLKQDIKICLVKNGYPPQYTPEVFREVMEQVENFKENESDYNEEKESTTTAISMYAPIEEESELLMVAENIIRQQLH